MIKPNYSLRLLVNGKYATQYTANGDQYLEGRPGSTYEIELKNNTNTDVEFVVSVDGLSILDGKAAGSKSTGYIVNAWGSARIKGWKLDKESAAEFKFGAKGKSYAALSTEGSVENAGVIGFQVFPRKYVAPIAPLPLYFSDPWYNQPYLSSAVPKGLVPRAEHMKSAVNVTSINQTGGITTASLNSTSTVSASLSGAVGQSFTSSVGTEFGDQTNFRTTTVDFTRASNTAAYQDVIYYGDAKDLNKLGIVLDWQQQERVKPQAFPADGCTPPQGWTPKGN